MVGQYYDGKKKEWKVASLRRLHRFKQGLPKNPFPMPYIDQLVDATVGHPRMSFLDAFQGYQQIPLPLEDKKKQFLLLPLEITITR